MGGPVQQPYALLAIVDYIPLSGTKNLASDDTAPPALSLILSFKGLSREPENVYVVEDRAVWVICTNLHNYIFRYSVLR